MVIKYYGNELYHHGILGQKWGKRRWQNEDGSLTTEGRIHYGYGERKRDWEKNRQSYKEKLKRAKDDFKNSDEYKEHKEQVVKNIKNAAKIGTLVAGTALVAYGAYKVVQLKKERADLILNGARAMNSYKNWKSMEYKAFIGNKLSEGRIHDRVVNPKPDDYYVNSLLKDYKRADENAKLYLDEALRLNDIRNNGSFKDKLNEAKKIVENSGRPYEEVLDILSDYLPARNK